MRKMKWCFMAVLIGTGLMLGGCAWMFPPPLRAVLVADRTSGPAPLSVTFSAAQSAGPITSFTLNFGDGSTPYSGANIGVSISHTYTRPGRYTATLTVQDARGITNSATLVIEVTAPPTTTVTLGAIPASGPAPLRVDFRAKIVAAPTRRIVRLRLEYGDGSPPSEIPVDFEIYDDWLPAPLRSHTYTSAGTYTATLTAIDNMGQATAGTARISVADPAPQITAFSFTPNPVPGPAPQAVSFTFTARAGAPGRRIVKYVLWFGDTTYFTAENLNVAHPNELTPTITHRYTAAGTYNVILRVWDDANRVTERSLTITIP